MADLIQQQRQREARLAKFRERRQEIADRDRYETWKKMASDPTRNPEQAAIYQRERIKSINLNVYEQMPWAVSFAEEVMLNEDESFVFRRTYSESIKVHKISNFSGSAPSVQTDPHDRATPLTLYWNETDPYYVPIEDPNWGTWEMDQEAQREAEFAMGLKTDQAVKSLLDTGLTTSSWTDGTHFKLSENIQTAHLPSGNQIDLSSYGVSKEFFIKLFGHFRRLGSLTYPYGRPIQVTRILVPTPFVEDIQGWVSVVSAFSGAGGTEVTPQQTIDPTTQREIWRFGVPQQFFGETFEMMPLETLPEGAVWVATNKPATIYVNKPSQAKSWRLMNREDENLTGFKARKTEGHMMPEPYAPNYARFDYS